MKEPARPPNRGRDSSSVTRTPLSASAHAAANPLKPPPMIVTFSGINESTKNILANRFVVTAFMRFECFLDDRNELQ